MIDKSNIQRLKKVLSAFERDIIQRLTKVLPNIGQWYCPTFDKSIVKVLQKREKHQYVFDFNRYSLLSVYMKMANRVFARVAEVWSKMPL